MEGVKGKIEGEMDIKQGRVSGKEYTISTNKGILRLRLYGIGGLISFLRLIRGAVGDTPRRNRASRVPRY